MWNKFYAWLWSFLPDKCEIRDRNTYITCPRKGALGNENLIKVGDEIWIMCDDCSVNWRNKFKTPL